MIRNWLAVGLLSASWMWGLEFYTPANGWLWAVSLLGAILLMAESPRRPLGRIDAAIALLLLLPAIWMLGWPHRAIPLGLVVGLLPFALGNTPQPVAALGWGAVRSSLVLAGQTIALQAYCLITTRNHDLPWPGPYLVGGVAWLLGADASVDGSNVVLFSTTGPQRLSATWELVFDPVTMLLLAGSLVLISLWSWEDRSWTTSKNLLQRIRPWLTHVGGVFLAIGLWTPIRLALLIGLFLHREMRAPETLKLTVMNQFFSPWVLALAGLGALASLAWWLRRRPSEVAASDPEARVSLTETRHRGLAAIVLVALVGLTTTLLVFDPVGRPRGGRVTVVERHSEWEPSDRPYDKVSYGEDPSYSYTAIYDYCGQYFETSRLLEDEKIDTARLSQCDVLVIKTPTAPYSDNEVQAVLRFVHAGGGLLLIGEHTDFMHTGSCLNQIATPLGFKFRPDNLFGVGDPYVQHVYPQRFPHPAVRNVPIIRYANSCSIDPGWSWGRAAVWNTGLWGLDADYNMANFFPEAYYRPEMRYGAYIQLWETRHGKGRVLAFTDSTVFSNFSTYEPGKAELMLDMLSWLNCRSLLDRQAVRILVRLAGLLLLAGTIWLAVTRYPQSGKAWLVWLACALLGYLGSTQAIAAWQKGGLPKCERPLVRVVLDRTVSRVPLSEGGFTPDPGGYGLLEQWIPRLGYYTVRAVDEEAFSGDVLLVVSPTESVTEAYRQRLIQWVSEGGKLIVLDSPDSSGTTANSLLWPFGISVYHANATRGPLRFEDSDWPGISVPGACVVEGGEPFAWIGDVPVAARTRLGKGTITAIGFGWLMNNENMGGTWFSKPEPTALKVYEVLFALIEAAVEDKSIRPPDKNASGQEKTTAADQN